MAMKTKRMHVAVEFGGVSLSGDGGARIGIKIDRDDMSLAQADAYLCGRRLHGKVTAVSGDDDPDQKKLLDDLEPEIETSFDVKRISVSKSQISSSLVFVLEDGQAAKLIHFAKHKGRLLIERVEVLEEAETPEPEETNEDEQS